MKIGYIGYGEAAYYMSGGLADTGKVEQYACSRSFSYSGKPEEVGVQRCDSYEKLCAVCDTIFVMTPNTAALVTAEKVAPYLHRGIVYVDLTSSSPDLMQKAATVIEPTGALFVDAAMLDSLPKYRHRVRIVISGSGADELSARLDEFNMRVEKVGDKPGAAGAIKLLRSLYTKVHLAFALEMLEGAASYGVEDYVMRSLAETMDAKDFISGMDERTCSGIIHAARRADELEMAANMLSDAGISNRVSRAGVDKLREIAALDIKSQLNGYRPKTWKEALSFIEESKKIQDRKKA